MLQKNLFHKCDEYFKVHRKKISIGAMALLLILMFYNWSQKSHEHKSEPSYEPLETYIPFGFTLVPIEILNHEQLQSMMSDKAVVDLFVENDPQPTAEAVRLVRSPIDPNVFGVLVEDHQAKNLLKKGHQFIVVLKNRQSQAPKKKKVGRRIYFEETL